MIKFIVCFICAMLTYYLSGYEAYIMFMLGAILLEVIKDD